MDAIRAAHPARFPQPLRVPLVGDGGAPIEAHLVIGNPTGSAAPPPGTRPPPGDPWRALVDNTLHGVRESARLRADLCADVILWPNPATEWPQILARWPGITTPIAVALQRKVGMVDATAAALSPAERAHLPPGAIVYGYAPTKADRFAYVIDPPDAMRWQIFQDGVRAEGADRWACDREMVAACVVRVVRADSGAPVHFEELVGRWPGFVVQAFANISRVAGASVEAELGE